MLDSCQGNECNYTELFDLRPAMWVPVQTILDGPYYIAEKFAMEIVKALQHGSERIFIEDADTLSDLGLIRREAAFSRTDEDTMYVVSERKCSGKWVKYFCSCPAFNFHGRCKHSLAEDRYNQIIMS